MLRLPDPSAWSVLLVFGFWHSNESFARFLRTYNQLDPDQLFKSRQSIRTRFLPGLPLKAARFLSGRKPQPGKLRGEHTSHTLACTDMGVSRDHRFREKTHLVLNSDSLSASLGPPTFFISNFHWPNWLLFKTRQRGIGCIFSQLLSRRRRPIPKSIPVPE